MEEKVEIWRTVTEFPNYKVSNFGRVTSTRICVNKKRPIPILKHSFLKPYKGRKGRYLMVRLFAPGLFSGKVFKLHLLVFYTFNPDLVRKPKFEVDHKDGNKDNCRLDNLQYISNRDNVLKTIDRSKTASKHPGVTFCKQTNKWRAQITHNNKHYPFKRRSTESEAIKDYQIALNRVNSGLLPV